MIYVRLTGGLGNQMFQYALGRSLAVTHSSELVLDVSSYGAIAPGDTPRSYELDTFNVASRLATPVEARMLGKALQPSRLSRLFGGPKLEVIRENGPAFQPDILTHDHDGYYVGYWQTEKYFTNVRAQLLQDFVPKAESSPANQEMAERIASAGAAAVSLHVRRGDYVTNPNAAAHHGLSPLEYYRTAITTMDTRVPGAHYFVFSDDIAWCQENLPLSGKATFVDINSGASAFEDIRLMSRCAHHIIANSSFSWWGAWLNDKPGKLVLAPAKWFNDPAAATADIYAQGWEKV